MEFLLSKKAKKQCVVSETITAQPGHAQARLHFNTKASLTPCRTVQQQQFREAAAHLHVKFPAKTFIFENWEGDWASRSGYDPKTPATDLALDSMVKWLAARQASLAV